MYIDTHAHLYDDNISANLNEVINNSLSSKVEKIFIPNCDSTTIEPMLSICKEYPNTCYPMVGLHPCYVKDNYQQELDLNYEFLKKHSFSAIGEIGLDYYWDLTFKEQQIDAFAQQISWANQLALPIVIHSRESTLDCINIVLSKKNNDTTGIFHCFSGNIEEANAIIDMGFYLGIGGVITYKKSHLPDIIKSIGLDHIVLETDAPYLAPVPYRGKLNVPNYIPIIAQTIADILEINIEKVMETTTNNALKVFSRS